jgi:hypothetical protein
MSDFEKEVWGALQAVLTTACLGRPRSKLLSAFVAAK